MSENSDFGHTARALAQENPARTALKMIAASIDQLTPKSCSACGSSFGCGATLTTADCWCMELPSVGPVAASDQGCLCPACLARAIGQLGLKGKEATDESVSRGAAETSLVEGEEYYLEGAAMVFTSRFLLRRGYCCESGCRHCPFDVAQA